MTIFGRGEIHLSIIQKLMHCLAKTELFTVMQLFWCKHHVTLCYTDASLFWTSEKGGCSVCSFFTG